MSNGDGLDAETRETVERLTDANPNDDAMAILAKSGVSPAHFEEVAEIVGEDVSGRDVSDTSAAKEDESSSASEAKPGDGAERETETGRDPSDARTPDVEAWADANFTDPTPGEFAPEWKARDFWMAHTPGDKKPYAPWGDADNSNAECDKHDEPRTCVECGHDARYKWSVTDNWTSKETVDEWVEMDPSLGGHVALLEKEADPWTDDPDPFAFVDGDDVRDPETGEVHPAFVEILERLGLTYADISTSGAGVHALYRGELPDGVKMAAFDLDDEPWGANDELPAVEFYDGKHVCVVTGDHVPGTPLETAEWDVDALEDVLDEHDALSERRADVDVSTDREDYDLSDYDPDATGSDETTTEIRDVFAALERLDVEHAAEETIVHDWNDTTSTSAGKRAFYPTWGPNSNGTATYINLEHGTYVDTGSGDYGTVVEMALISEENWTRGRMADGEDWLRGVDHLRNLGFDIPELETSTEHEPESALPLARLEALDHADARRYAKHAGVEWPTTREATERLRGEIFDALRGQQSVVLDAPTALGKSYTVATERWLDRVDVTDEAPVVHFHETREARDQAAEASEKANVSYEVLLGRKEACPVAAGRHDPASAEEDDDPDVTVTMNGQPASEWLTAVCDGRGVPFSVAHAHLDEHNDQGVTLPCHAEDGEECDATAQWDGLPRNGDGNASVDVIHATHQFAHVPSLRSWTNMIFDERPEFRADLSTGQVRKSVTEFLKEVGAPVRTWEAFVQLARTAYDVGGDAGAERDAMKAKLDDEPEREWFLQTEGAHTLAPALAKAVWYALSDEDGADANGRYHATVPYEPPRLDAEAGDDDGWNREFVSVVLDDDNDVRVVRTSPDLNTARAVVGLDAHPAVPLWQLNTKPSIKVEPVLSPEERRLWRRFERGLQVVQVGDAVRPLASGEYFNEDSTRTLLAHLREAYGDRFGTCITASAVETETAALMGDVGIKNPETMHYGEEKSRNDFGAEDVGFVNGSIDPGDDYVLDLLAEYEADATVETVDTDDGVKRARGRGFEGADADIADSLLASVRENHVAQAAGRYARDARDPENTATVFVRTSALPPGFADLKVEGVAWTATDDQRAIVRALRERPTATAKELAEEADVSKRHVQKTLKRLADADVVERKEGVGTWGADVFRALAGAKVAEDGLADLDGIPTFPEDVDAPTWGIAIADTGPSSRTARLATSNGGDSPAGGGPPDTVQQGLNVGD